MADYSQGDLTQRNITIAKAQLWELIKVWVDYQATVEGKYVSNDLRYSAYSKFQKRLCSYYLDLAFLSDFLNDSSILEKDFGVKDFESKKDLIRHHFVFNRWAFFVGMFSLFEDSVGLIFDGIVSDDEKGKITANLSPLAADEEIMTLIKQKFPKEASQFREWLKRKERVIPSAKKFDKLVSFGLLNAEDRKFCGFASYLRNTIHSNGFYFGLDAEHEGILGENYTFKDGAILDFITMNRCINWGQALVEIFKKIAENPKVGFILDVTVSKK